MVTKEQLAACEQAYAILKAAGMPGTVALVAWGLARDAIAASTDVMFKDDETGLLPTPQQALADDYAAAMDDTEESVATEYTEAAEFLAAMGYPDTDLDCSI